MAEGGAGAGPGSEGPRAEEPGPGPELKCPVCGVELRQVSHTATGVQAHVNACLDAGAGGPAGRTPTPSRPTAGPRKRAFQPQPQLPALLFRTEATAAGGGGGGPASKRPKGPAGGGRGGGRAEPGPAPGRHRGLFPWKAVAGTPGPFLVDCFTLKFPVGCRDYFLTVSSGVWPGVERQRVGD